MVAYLCSNKLPMQSIDIQFILEARLMFSSVQLSECFSDIYDKVTRGVNPICVLPAIIVLCLLRSSPYEKVSLYSESFTKTVTVYLFQDAQPLYLISQPPYLSS